MQEEKPHVFLVDDDPLVLETLTLQLESFKLSVKAYSSTTAFLENYSDEHGCLVLDLSLPETTGLDFQHELNRLNIDLPIIFVSGRGTIPDSVKALRAGALDFLQKPIDTARLLERIQEAFKLDAGNRARRELQRLLLSSET